MIMHREDGVSPVLAVVMIVGLIIILAAIVVPVAVSTVYDFSVQEKKVVDVAVNVDGNTIKVNIAKGKSSDMLNAYSVLVTDTNGELVLFNRDNGRDTRNQWKEYRDSNNFQSSSQTVSDINKIAKITVVGEFSDDTTEVIYTGKLEPGAVLVDVPFVEVHYYYIDGDTKNPIGSVERKNVGSYLHPLIVTEGDKQYIYSNWLLEVDGVNMGACTIIPEDLEVNSINVIARNKETINGEHELLVNLYFMDENGDYPSEPKAEYKNKPIIVNKVDWDSISSALQTNVPEYNLVDYKIDKASSDAINPSSTFKIFIERTAYKVYYREGEIIPSGVVKLITPDGVKNLPYEASYIWGQTVTVYSLCDIPSGKEFNRWKYEPKYLVVTDGTFTMPKENVDITALWLNKYNLSFNMHGHGVQVQNKTGILSNISRKDISPRPSDPTAQGYSFGGWYTDAGFTETSKWNWESDETLEEDVVLHAKWTPNNVGYTVIYKTQTLLKNPQYDEKRVKVDGYTDTLIDKKALENNPPVGFTVVSVTGDDIVRGDGLSEVTVCYNRLSYPVKVQVDSVNNYGTVNDGKVNANQLTVSNVPYGMPFTTSGNVLTIGNASTTVYSTVTATPNADTPQYSYSFSGWSSTEGIITGETTITASFNCVEREYTITWNANGGTIDGKPSKQDTEKKYGVQINAPTPDDRTGYNFIKWKSGGSELTAESPLIVTSNATYEAVWKDISYAINWDLDDGSALYSTLGIYGQEIDYPTKPTRTGYTFVKWVNSDTNEDAPLTMPKNVLNLKAVWNPKSYTFNFESDAKNFFGRDKASVTKTSVTIEAGKSDTLANVNPTTYKLYLGVIPIATYDFKGWSISGDETEFTGNQKVTMTEDIINTYFNNDKTSTCTLNAYWKKR